MDRLNPIAVTVYFLFVSGRIMFSMDPVLLLCSLLGAVSLHFILEGCRQMKTNAAMLALFVLMALINPLVNHNGATVLFVLNDNPVTLEALLYGAAAAGMIAGVFFWFRSFAGIMTSDKLLYVFGGFSPGIALILSMALRYVPLFGRQARKVSQAQKALGLYREDNIIDSYKGGLRVFSVMVTWTLENGIITADSMAARGYGTGKRSRYSLFSWRREDVLFVFVSAALFAASIVFDRGFAYYPVIEAGQMTQGVWFGYAAYALLALLPAILYGKEAIKWRILIYRM